MLTARSCRSQTRRYDAYRRRPIYNTLVVGRRRPPPPLLISKASTFYCQVTKVYLMANKSENEKAKGHLAIARQ